MDEVFYSRKHSLYFESSGLCVIKYDGPLLEADIHNIHSELRRWSQDRLRFSILVNLSSTGDVEPAARKAAAETLDVPNLTAVAGYGQSWHVRATATLTAALIRAFGKVRCPIRFFATEEDARTWLEGLDRKANVMVPTAAQRAPSEQAPRP
jgi:hypothetical protein